MAGLGIYHYGARFYSPYINRFLSADTIVPSYANPQSLNRYSYVNNNPLRYVDPTGHMIDDGCSLGCTYTPPPPVNYCTTHPGACGNNNNPVNNNTQTSISSSTVSIPLGISSSYSPTTSSYAEQAEEGSCGGCSMEPVEVANPFDAFNFVGQWGINYLAINSQDIPVYITMIPNANGSVSVNSLTVDNTNTGVTVAVVEVSFKTSGNTSPCYSTGGSCVTNAPYGYNVQSQPGIYSSDTALPGIGAVTQPNSMQIVNLIPSGYPNNQTNTFNNSFQIRVVLGNSLTGDVYNPISINIHP
jgi:RHS repeat-associated protein